VDKGITTASKPIDKPSARKCLKRIADRDAQAGGDGSFRSDVDEERSNKNGGPGPVAEEEQRRKTDSGWRPHRGRAAMDEGQPQTKFTSDEVGGRNTQKSREPRPDTPPGSRRHRAESIHHHFWAGAGRPVNNPARNANNSR